MYIRYQSYEIARVECRETPQISQASDISTEGNWECLGCIDKWKVDKLMKKACKHYVLEISSPKQCTRGVSLQSAIFVGSESRKMFLLKVQMVQELLPKTMLLVSFIATGLWNM
jgi:hypothetical protein